MNKISLIVFIILFSIGFVYANDSFCVFPNPCVVNDGIESTGTSPDGGLSADPLGYVSFNLNDSSVTYHGGIIFYMIPKYTEIKIYSMIGEKIRNTMTLNDNPVWGWNLKNDKGKKVHSGFYIYYLKLPDGRKKLGKLAVVR